MISKEQNQGQIKRKAILPMLILAAAGAWLFFSARPHFWIPWVFSAWFLAGILISPVLIRPLDVAVQKTVDGLLWLTTRLILAFVYYLILTPIALWFRLLGRDRLHMKFPGGETSYWHKRPPEKQTASCEKQY